MDLRLESFLEILSSFLLGIILFFQRAQRMSTTICEHLCALSFSKTKILIKLNRIHQANFYRFSTKKQSGKVYNIYLFICLNISVILKSIKNPSEMMAVKWSLYKYVVMSSHTLWKITMGVDDIGPRSPRYRFTLFVDKIIIIETRNIHGHFSTKIS